MASNSLNRLKTVSVLSTQIKTFNKVLNSVNLCFYRKFFVFIESRSIFFKAVTKAIQ